MCAQEVQKKTLAPQWNEDKWLLVQEPKTQILRMQLFDHDAINLKARACMPAPRHAGCLLCRNAPLSPVGWRTSRLLPGAQQHFMPVKGPRAAPAPSRHYSCYRLCAVHGTRRMVHL